MYDLFSLLYFQTPFRVLSPVHNDKLQWKLEVQTSALQGEPRTPPRFPHATHLSCRSLHTATITRRFPKMAIRITAERNVSSTTFSTDLKPSLELEDRRTHTHAQRTEGNPEMQARKFTFSSVIYRKVTSPSAAATHI